MDVATAEFLVSDAGEDLLKMVASLPGDAPDQLLTLRKRGIESATAAGAVEVAAARWRARKRFANADRLFFTADALAQATSPMIAAYHARQLRDFRTVADLGCGVGMDAIAFAQQGIGVLALDTDPVRLIFARANAVRCGVTDQINFRQQDVTDLNWDADALYWDPSRRRDSDNAADSRLQRVSRHAERYEPPLSFLTQFRARVRGGCVKLSPALPDELLDTLNARREFLSEHGECKECCLWFGDAVGTANNALVSAVLLPEEIVLQPAEDAPVATQIGTYIFDPDAALIRANALGSLARILQAQVVSRDDSYLTSDISPASRRFANAYRVLVTMPYHPRTLSAWLVERGIGRLVVKKRHFPKEPDAVARELGLRGGGKEITLILARVEKSHLAVVCEPVSELVR